MARGRSRSRRGGGATSSSLDALPEPAEQDGGDQDAPLHEVEDVGLEVEHRQPGLDDAQEQDPDDRPRDVELTRPEYRRPEERGGEGRQKEAQARRRAVSTRLRADEHAYHGRGEADHDEPQEAQEA